MSIDYFIFSANTGECILKERVCLPFLWEKAVDIGQPCYVKWDGEKIADWSLDKKIIENYDNSLWYYSKRDIARLQALQPASKDIFDWLLQEGNCDALLVWFLL